MLTDSEFKDFIEDSNKIINGDIEWQEDEDHSLSVEFRVRLQSTQNYPVFVQGFYNPLKLALTYAIIHLKAGRIYGLDMGKEHPNPDRTRVGGIHKHRWTEEYQDKWAYRPPQTLLPQLQNLWKYGNNFAKKRLFVIMELCKILLQNKEIRFWYDKYISRHHKKYW
jgi:hypothetical protein